MSVCACLEDCIDLDSVTSYITAGKGTVFDRIASSADALATSYVAVAGGVPDSDIFSTVGIPGTVSKSRATSSGSVGLV